MEPAKKPAVLQTSTWGKNKHVYSLVLICVRGDYFHITHPFKLLYGLKLDIIDGLPHVVAHI